MALSILMYRTLSLPSHTTKSSYSTLGLILTNMSMRGPRIFIMICCPLIWFLSSMSVWTKALGILAVITSHFCFTSMVAVIRIDSIIAVGLAASLCSVYACWVLPLAHVHALILPSCFLTRKIKHSIAHLLSTCVISLTWIDSNTALSCSCFILLVAAVFPHSPNFFRTFFKTVGLNELMGLLICRASQFDVHVAHHSGNDSCCLNRVWLLLVSLSL